MSRYDGLIIPRSYSEYINKTDAATLQQALQLSGVMDNAPTAGSNKPAKSGGIYSAIVNNTNVKNIIITSQDDAIPAANDITVRYTLNKYIKNGDTQISPGYCFIESYKSGSRRITQKAYLQSNSTASAEWIRNGVSTDNGATWTFGNWERVVVNKIKEVTGVTSANGNLELGLNGEKYVIIAVQTYNSQGVNNDALAIPYKLGDNKPSGETGGRWGVHCISSLANYSVIANTTVYLTIHYYEK